MSDRRAEQLAGRFLSGEGAGKGGQSGVVGGVKAGVEGHGRGGDGDVFHAGEGV